MDLRSFKMEWDVELIKERIDSVLKDVEHEQYETALNYLNMIKDKVEIAEDMIRISLLRDRIDL